ncbi:Pre-mRNA splicing factor-domain-containing protein [Syncephalis fuscata]|nr:Pre-mRNA splicing factor-domain-containing protein [Syncephalis fuscata]
MGGGDLNLKKSWHTGTFRNQETVWKREQEVAEENKKLEQLRKELEEERQLQELQRIQESSGVRKRAERLEWMYAAGPGQSAATRNADLEQYLLGKKRVDDIVDAGHTVDELSANSTSIFQQAMNQKANNIRDTFAKVREDPLLMIKKREQQSLENIMSNPVKMKQLAEVNKCIVKDKKKKEKKEKKHRNRHRESESSDREDGDEVTSAHYHKRQRIHVDRRDYRRYDRRSSRSPSSRKHRSPNNYRPHRDHGRHENNYARSRHHEERQRQHSSSNAAPDDKALKEQERQRRLAAMVSDAEALDRERDTRIETSMKEEAEQERRDQAVRMERGRHGTGRDFLSETSRAIYGTADSLRLEDRVRRNRAGLQRQSAVRE